MVWIYKQFIKKKTEKKKMIFMKNLTIYARIHFLGVTPTSMCHFFHPSVVHHFSGTIHHLIIIFGTRVKWWYLQDFFFHFYEILIFWAGRGVKGPKWKITITSVMHHISGTLYHTVVQMALRGRGGGKSPSPLAGGTRNFAGGNFFYWGGFAQGIFFIFWSFCDAEINIPYILNIS